MTGFSIRWWARDPRSPGHSRVDVATRDSSERMPNPAESIIRCPYCRVENEFRPMRMRAEGWSQCESCGHNEMPLDPEFRCVCSKCDVSQSHTFPHSL